MSDDAAVNEAKPGDALPAERLRTLELALTLTSQRHSARLRMLEWVALGLGMIVVYLVFVSPPWQPFRAADVVILCFVAGTAGVLVLYEWRQAVACRILLDALPVPEKSDKTPTATPAPEAQPAQVAAIAEPRG